MDPRRLLVPLAALAVLLGAPPAQPAGDCVASEATTSYGRFFDPGLVLSVEETAQRPTAGFSDNDAALMKVKFVLKADDPRPWRVTVYDAAFHVVANFTADDFRKAGGLRWTGVLPGDGQAVLTGPADTTAEISIAGVVVFPKATSDTRYFSIQHATPAWKGLYEVNDPIARKAGAAVGMIYGAGETAQGGIVNWCCSGVMVAPDVLLTNYHCGVAPGVNAWSTQVRENMVVDLSRDDRADVRQQYSVAEVLEARPGLDYALLRLTPVAGGSQYVGAPVFQSLADRASRVPGTHLFVIHHAQCQAKLVSRDCRAELKAASNDASDAELAHACDTEPGASGAPVFDEEGHLVALHHRGFPRDGTCKVTGKKLNYAVLMSRIVDDLQAQKPDVARSLGVPPAAR